MTVTKGFLQIVLNNLIDQLNKERAETTARIKALEDRVMVLENKADDDRTVQLERNERH